MTDAEKKVSARQLSRLIRILGKGERRMEEIECEPRVLTEAISRGLVQVSRGGITARPEAAAYLRRAIIDEEEAYAEQHRDMVTTSITVEGARRQVRRNVTESTLGAVARMKDRDGQAFLPVEAVDAGERLLADFTRGQMQPRITASWEPRVSGRTKGSAGGKADIAHSALAARDRFSQAMDAMGPELAGVAVDVCCFSKGLELVERERLWPARSAKLMLRTALMALARHYSPPVAKGRRVHRWSDDDYRPKV